MKRIIFTKGPYRIVEIQDEIYRLEDLEGDTFCPDNNQEICPVKLKAEQKAFRRQVEHDGVFGYVLEKWNPEIDTGWEHEDSCFGFVGYYDPSVELYNHYIVDELKQKIESKI